MNPIWSIQVKPHPQPLRPIFERLKGEGYHMLEWRSPTRDGITIPETDLLESQESATEIRDLSAEFDLKMAYHAPQGDLWHFGVLFPDAARTRFRDSIRRAAAIHAQIMTFHLGITTGDTRESAIQQGADVIRQNLNFAEDLDIQLCVENVFDEHSVATPKDCEILFDAVNDDRLRFTLDTGHANLCNCLHELLDTVSNRLIYTHIHDNNGLKDQHFVPGHGAINWPEFMAHLNRIAYTGPFNFELREDAILSELIQRLGE